MTASAFAEVVLPKLDVGGSNPLARCLSGLVRPSQVLSLSSLTSVRLKSIGDTTLSVYACDWATLVGIRDKHSNKSPAIRSSHFLAFDAF